MKKIAIRIFQLFILLVIRIYYFGRVKVLVDGELKLNTPVVVVANHAHRHDPFIVSCFLPLKTVLKVFPYGFMTANVYYYKMWRPVAFLAGCFPAKPKADSSPPESYGVGAAVNLLNSYYSVVMFPEGRRTDTPIKAKPGITKILHHHKSSVLLCHISWQQTNRGKMAVLTIKQADRKVDTSDPDAIMASIYSLRRDVRLSPQKRPAV
jgi:1-acyl-sn-glycerol-3-phosphate acyltransferase